METFAYICEDSLEGMLSAVFEAYEHREFPDDIVVRGLFQQRLGEKVRYVQTDIDHACRVRAGLIRTCGFRAYEAVRAVYLSDDRRKGSAIHVFVRYAMKRGAQALDDVAHPDVSDFVAINRFVYNEVHHWKEFLRFRQVEGGLYFAQCNPKASVVPLLMGWFSARFNTQDFMIYDEVHALAGISHGGSWALVKTDALEVPSDTAEERSYARAWKTFVRCHRREGASQPRFTQAAHAQTFLGRYDRDERRGAPEERLGR